MMGIKNMHNAAKSMPQLLNKVQQCKCYTSYQSRTISARRDQHTESDNRKREQQSLDRNSNDSPPYLVIHISTKTHRLAKSITHIADNHYGIQHPRCFCASSHSTESNCEHRVLLVIYEVAATSCSFGESSISR